MSLPTEIYGTPRVVLGNLEGQPALAESGGEKS
jgi:hypothetical protein